MGISDVRAWLVSYDIRKPKRLCRVHHWMMSRAVAVQYSVFVGLWNERNLQETMKGVLLRINRNEDDVRAYALAADCRIDVRGAATLGAGVTLRVDGPGILRKLGA